MKQALALLACVAALLPLRAADDNDVILKAMRDELERSRQLRVASLDPPYFIEYFVEDADLDVVAATLGALVNSNRSTIRIPSVKVRVGSYNFDNTDHVYSDYYNGSRYDPDRLPLDLSYGATRQVLWLATDRAFKTAEEAISRKRSALKNVNLPDQLPDYSQTPSTQAILPVQRKPIDENLWRTLVVKLSGVFTAYPQVLSSGLEFQSIQSTTYLATSEGTTLRVPENIAFLRVRAVAQAPDGMMLRNADVFQSFDVNGLPPETEMRRGITAIAEDLTALTRAPIGEGYDGPVLFEPRAAAQLFGQLLGDNLKITRKPVPQPGRPVPYLPSELENKIGSRILPDWMDVLDDPTQTDWHGQSLFGHYLYDMEGVPAKPLALVDKGVLKTFLLTRTPVLKGFETTNGRARMHGPFGAYAPGYGNLFVRATETVPSAELKKKLIDLCKQRNKPYGILIRKLDFPSSASFEEMRRMTSAMSQSGGGTRPVSLPLLAYRVYPDGREELVRGVRFRGLSTRSFRDIVAATADTYVLNFMDSNAMFALMGGGSFVTNSSVIAPGVLFDEMELEKIEEELPKLPIVPAPAISLN